jgi:hypothetical protein
MKNDQAKMFQLEIKKNITKYTEEEDKKTAS